MSIPLPTPIQAFLAYLEHERRYSPHTISSYQLDLTQWWAFLTSAYDAPPIDRVTTPMIRTWLAELKEEGISSRSINRKISTLQSLYKFLLKNGQVSCSPLTTIGSLKIQKRLPAFIAEPDMHRLLEDLPFSKDWQGITEQLMISVLYATGIRVSELVNWTIQQFDPSNAQMRVIGKGNKERIIPLSSDLQKAIQAYIVARPEVCAGIPEVFCSAKGKKLVPRQVYTSVKKHLSRVTTQQKRSPHILRHSFATHLMNNGAELTAVKELLGHTSLAATQVYTHNSIDQLKEVFRKAHPKA
ncbi:MAG: tyrosine-type recombinase/integrase [Chitinophagia bacterium]|jgi:integrase/recombinase XerC